MSIVSIDKDEERLRLVIVVEFGAPIEAVWQLWADPRKLERWWGPPTHPAAVHDHELAPGGAVRYSLDGPESESSRGWWSVETVDAPTGLTFTDGWADADGAPVATMPTTAVDVRLAESGGRTRMELRFAFSSREHMAQLERWGAFDVFRQSVAQMDALVAA